MLHSLLHLIGALEKRIEYGDVRRKQPFLRVLNTDIVIIGPIFYDKLFGVYDIKNFE